MKKKTKKQQGLWDLLIPILIVIVILPCVVHLAVYSCGYSKYDWYSNNDILSDFYCYYKSYLLDIVGIFSGIILILRLTLYREKTKDMKLFLPAAIYCLFVVLSTIFSVNQMASLQGNFASFESCIVLIVYVIMAVYAYQIMESERDYRYIWYAIIGISVFFILIGSFQIFQHDLMNYEWVQRLIMSDEQFSLYGGEIEDAFTGNNVYLTLYNPNYAGVTLTMLFTIVFVMFLSEQQKKKQFAYGVLSIGLFLLIWFTYSRASLLATFLIALIVGISHITSKKHLVIGGISFLLILSLLICIDAGLNFKYLSRMIDKNTREPLEAMTTDRDGIHIIYDGKEYLLHIEHDSLVCSTSSTKASLYYASEGQEMSLPMEPDAKAFFEGQEIYLYLAENTLTFLKKDDTYYYCTVSGKLTDMAIVEAVDLHGLEYLGSARGYIWSRVFPLLDDYLFVGSGPDTFAEVFPQHDYAGKVVYSDRPDMVIEKAHNDYLTKWIQTGALSVLCLVTFYLLFIRKGLVSFAGIKTISDRTLTDRLGMGCYLACISYMFTSLFNDSTLQTAPFFWVFAGIALSCMKKR